MAYGPYYTKLTAPVEYSEAVVERKTRVLATDVAGQVKTLIRTETEIRLEYIGLSKTGAAWVTQELIDDATPEVETPFVEYSINIMPRNIGGCLWNIDYNVKIVSIATEPAAEFEPEEEED